MEIIKRNGTIVEYQKEKIEWAMRKSFAGVEEAIDEAKISAMADAVERFIIDHPEKRNVESIQDAVELTLMSNGFFNVAKSYILFRYQRNELRKVVVNIAEEVGDETLETTLRGIAHHYPRHEYRLPLLG